MFTQKGLELFLVRLTRGFDILFDCKVLHTFGKFSLIQWKLEGYLQQLDGQDGQEGFFAIMCLVIFGQLQISVQL